MEDSFFRELNPEETEQFKQWARDNFTPGMEVKSVWHPVIRAEIARLQASHDALNESVETPLGESLDGGNDDYDFSSENEYNDDGCLDGCSDCEGYCDEYGDKDPSPYDGDYSED